jgi:hypothetical protein
LKERCKNGPTESPKYVSVSIQRLIALKDSKLHDLARGAWGFEDGQTALQFLLEIVGIDVHREVVKATPVRLKDTSYQPSQVGYYVTNTLNPHDSACSLPKPLFLRHFR